MKFNKLFKSNIEDTTGNITNSIEAAPEEFLETWVHGIHMLNDKFFIYKYLLVGITKVLQPTIELKTSSLSYEAAEAETKIFLQDYSDAKILEATSKVLDWYNQDGYDELMTLKVRNFIKRVIHEKSKDPSFKESLVNKAEEYRAQLFLEEDMIKVKNKLKEAAIYRECSIYLYKLKPNNTLAFGGSCPKSISFFVPTAVTLEEYTMLIIKALKDLGFESSDISYRVESSKGYDSCRISLTW